MSDLQCPATLLVVRHAEAEPDGAEISDTDRLLSERGHRQAQQLAADLVTQALRGVYSSSLARARDTGRPIAAALGVPLEQLPGLHEYSVGELAHTPGGGAAVRAIIERWIDGDLDVVIPGAESGRQVLDRFSGALAELSDRHRGETVAVISHGGVMAFCLPRLCGNVADDAGRARFIPNCGIVRLRVDADGWVLDSWPTTDQAPS
jgi:broad specificity phosphatase PhoE